MMTELNSEMINTNNSLEAGELKTENRTTKPFALRFFSKIIFICNLCFIAAVILRWVENLNKQKGNFDGVIKLQPLESTIVVLGYGAIFFNLIFNLVVLFLLILKKDIAVYKWLIWFNFLILIIQVYYFFF
jgi:hypothetical protein